MQRIQDPTAVTAQPAPPALNGQPVGFFQGSVTGGIVTRIRYWWLNMMQEELIAILVAASLPIDGSKTVLQALRALFNVGVSYNATDNGLLIFPGGLFRLAVTASVPSGNGLQTVTITLPFSFPNTCLDASICFIGNGPPSTPGSISVQPISRSQVTVSTNFGTSSTGNLGVCITAWGN